MDMKRFFAVLLILIIILTIFPVSKSFASSKTYITQSEFTDKLKGSWIGQMIGVSWSASTEFKYGQRLIPDKSIPEWTSDMINDSFYQDDIYVEIPFMKALRNNGLYLSWKDLGECFRNTNFSLYHANDACRSNLLIGIDAPYSGHYLFNNHYDDIDWQIESDFIGTIFPNQINSSAYMSWKIGHLMNYGDGVYGGVFVSAMHSKAFTASTIDEIVDAGISSIPKECQYRKVLEDVLSWKSQGKSFKENWRLANNKWGKNDICPDGYNNPFDIDAKINGAYVLLGLLYGQGDFEKSMRLAMQCGQDSDCNTSTVGGILGNWLGESRIPHKWKSNLNHTTKFYGTDYNFDDVVNLNFELTKQALEVNIENVWEISPQNTKPLILEQWSKNNTIPSLYAKITGNGLNIRFNAAAKDNDGILQYQWFFGDLLYKNGACISHKYKSPGKYEAVCYVTDKKGNTAFKVFTVECFKNAPPKITPVEYKLNPNTKEQNSNLLGIIKALLKIK